MLHRADSTDLPAIDPIAVPEYLITRVETDDALSLLAAGVPLSLMIDLVLPSSSQEILLAEGGDAHWLPAHVA